MKTEEKQKIIKLSAVALAISCSGSVIATDAHIERDPILSIGEVIVIHGERPSAVQMSATSWTISEAEIKASGAQSLDQILNDVPGVYVRTAGQGTPRVDIRGFKTRHVTLLINGVPANGAEDGQFDPSVIPASQIAAVEVSVGPTSVLYGPGGAGGIINIITKQGEGAPMLSGRMEVAEENTFNGDISAAGSGDNWQSLITLSHQETGGYPLSSDYVPNANQSEDVRNNSDRQVSNLYTQGSYWFSDATQLTANMSLRTGHWGKPDLDDGSKNNFERMDDYDSQTFQLGMAHKINDMFVVKGFGYHNQSSQLLNEYKDETYSELELSQDGRSTVQGGNFQFITNFNDSSILTSALIAEHQSWESTSIPTKAGSKDKNLDDSAWLYTSALEYQYQHEGDYGFTVGAAYHDQDRHNASETDYSAQVSGFWQAAEHTLINTGIARKVRFPSMTNLYGGSGNPDLVAELSHHFELGVRQELGLSSSMTVAGFYTDSENYIAKVKNDAGKNVYQNMGNYKFSGVDVSFKNNHFDNLWLTLDYSFLKTEDKDALPGMEALKHRPRHQLRFNVEYEFSFSTRVSMNVERIMGQVFYDKKRVNKYDLKDYTVVDINIVQPIFANQLSLYLRATNLLDENYSQSDGIPLAGRQVFIGVDWQI